MQQSSKGGCWQVVTRDTHHHCTALRSLRVLLAAGTANPEGCPCTRPTIQSTTAQTAHCHLVSSRHQPLCHCNACGGRTMRWCTRFAGPSYTAHIYICTTRPLPTVLDASQAPPPQAGPHPCGLRTCSLACSLPLAMSHTCTDLSQLPLASHRPLGLNATLLTLPVWPCGPLPQGGGRVVHGCRRAAGQQPGHGSRGAARGRGGTGGRAP